MNKKAGIGDVLWENAIYLIILGVFVLLMVGVLYQNYNGASIWEQYYGTEIVRMIDLAHPGDEISLDVQKASIISESNKGNLQDMFSFNSQTREVCVHLSLGKETCYKYFNDVIIVDKELKLGVPENVLYFKVAERSVAK